jgi:hypothetical protein
MFVFWLPPLLSIESRASFDPIENSSNVICISYNFYTFFGSVVYLLLAVIVQILFFSDVFVLLFF